MNKIIGIVAALGLAGVLIWFVTRGKNGAAAQTPSDYTIRSPGEYELPAPEVDNVKVEIDGTTYTIPTEPGQYEIVIGGDEFPKGPGGIAPEPEPAPPLMTEIPPTLIPVTGPGSWYEIQQANEVLGITPQEYQAIYSEAQQTPPGLRTPEQEFVYSQLDTMEQATAIYDFKQMVLMLGGAYLGGVLTPPPSWTGGVTAFANYVRERVNAQSNSN